MGSQSKFTSFEQSLMVGIGIRPTQSVSLRRSQCQRCGLILTVVALSSLLACYHAALCGQHSDRPNLRRVLRSRSGRATSCQCCVPRRSGEISESTASYLIRGRADQKGIYPEGIDVLAKTDFYSVSVRRIAFTNAAVSVAM